MNGFEKHGLDEAAFEDKNGVGSGLRTFDAFRKYILGPGSGDQGI
jgi:hypothetical protein